MCQKEKKKKTGVSKIKNGCQTEKEKKNNSRYKNGCQTEKRKKNKKNQHQNTEAVTVAIARPCASSSRASYVLETAAGRAGDCCAVLFVASCLRSESPFAGEIRVGLSQVSPTPIAQHF